MVANKTVAASAKPIGIPGCPELAPELHPSPEPGCNLPSSVPVVSVARLTYI